VFCVARRFLVLSKCDRILRLGLVRLTDELRLIPIRDGLPHFAEFLCAINHGVVGVRFHYVLTLLARPQEVSGERSLGSFRVFRRHFCFDTSIPEGKHN